MPHARTFPALAALLVLAPLPLRAASGGSPAATAARYRVTNLGTLGGAYSEAFGIDASGAVVGEAATAAGSAHAFLYAGGRMTDLALPGTVAVARAINASGQIAGYYSDGSYQAFLDTNG